MTPNRRDASGRIMQFSAGVEMATGVGLLLVPALVVRLLFGPGLPDAALPIARVTGIALLSFGLACWQSSWHVGNRPQAFRALLTYNALVAGYLGHLGLAEMGGVLLWPAVAIHALVAGGLVAMRKIAT